jgi:hypothetical protein
MELVAIAVRLWRFYPSCLGKNYREISKARRPLSHTCRLLLGRASKNQERQSKTPAALTAMRQRFHLIVSKICVAGQLSKSRRIHTSNFASTCSSLTTSLKSLTHPRLGLIARTVGQPRTHKHSQLIQKYCTMAAKTQPAWTPPKPVEGLPKLKIYNSLTRRKDEFYPADEETGLVRLYSCGPTLYDDNHLGHGIVSLRQLIDSD